MQTQLKAICRQALGLIALLLFSGATPVLAAESQAKGKEPTLAQKPTAAECEELLGEHWEALLATKSTEQDEVNYWIDLAIKCQDKFELMWKNAVAKGKLNEFCECYVDQFGKSLDADMRWLLASCNFSVPGVAKITPYTTKAQIELHTCISKAIVRRALKDPEFLASHYRIVSWSALLMGFEGDYMRFANSLGDTRDAFLSESHLTEEEYWLHAHSTVVFIYAASMEELLRDSKADEMKDIFIRWATTLKDMEDSSILVPDHEHFRWKIEKKPDGSEDAKKEFLPKVNHPETPFANWKWEGNRKPPRILIFSEIRDAQAQRRP